MSIILSIETSTTVCSAALHDNKRLIASEITHVPNTAASQLAVMIEKIISQSPKALDAVAVSAGPGSYTGLRIGVATAKGMCYALDIPLIAVSSLEIMAEQVSKSNDSGAML
jgi:tRNA threonylcarbamoyladenosine biosynthesis protein TsaB